MKQVSIDNGATFTTPAKAIEALGFLTFVQCMDDEASQKICDEYAPCSAEEFLTHYLEIAPCDLIIG